MIFMKVKDDYNLGCYQNWKKDKKVKKIDFLFKLKIKRAKMQVKKY